MEMSWNADLRLSTERPAERSPVRSKSNPDDGQRPNHAEPPPRVPETAARPAKLVRDHGRHEGRKREEKELRIKAL